MKWIILSNQYFPQNVENKEILKASQSVVKIKTGKGTGTAFFITKHHIMTNHHVVGHEYSCFKGGCYAEIEWDFEKNKLSKNKAALQASVEKHKANLIKIQQKRQPFALL